MLVLPAEATMLTGDRRTQRSVMGPTIVEPTSAAVRQVLAMAHRWDDDVDTRRDEGLPPPQPGWALMSNSVDNELIVTGTPESLTELRLALGNAEANDPDERLLEFDRLVPMPEGVIDREPRKECFGGEHAHPMDWFCCGSNTGERIAKRPT